MFEPLLYLLRAHGVPVGGSAWLRFQAALGLGLIHDLPSLYRVGRAVLVHGEGWFSAYDTAFRAWLEGVGHDPALAERLEAWLRERCPAEGPEGRRLFSDLREMLDALADTARRQEGPHAGGDRWIGTGGRSPWGRGGRSAQGVALGREGGGRTGVRLPDVRAWDDYRADRRLATRDLRVALRALRQLVPEGPEELDLDATVRRTAEDGGEIRLVTRRARRNRVHLVLLLDTGGSMEPHVEAVTRLLTAASELRCFRSVTTWQFHNCIRDWLYRDWASWDRVPVDEVLADLGPTHRLLFVGDASMAPWELFGRVSPDAPDGIEQLRRFARRCPASAWLNPDPERWWRHPTVEAIGRVIPMYPLTLAGLRDAVRRLRAPR